MKSSVRDHASIGVGALVVLLIFVIFGFGTYVSYENYSPTLPNFGNVTLTITAASQSGSTSRSVAMEASFSPVNFTVQSGQILNLTIINYDSSYHSFTSPSLNLSFIIPPSAPNGAPSISYFQLTTTKVGTFTWYCAFCHTAAEELAWLGSKGQTMQDNMSGYLTVT